MNGRSLRVRRDESDPSLGSLLRDLWPKDRLGRWSAVATIVLLALLVVGAIVRTALIWG